MGDIMFSYDGTNGWTALDKIRWQGRLTSLNLPKPPILSVTSDNYSVWYSSSKCGNSGEVCYP